jgi:hypothetical protein
MKLSSIFYAKAKTLRYKQRLSTLSLQEQGRPELRGSGTAYLAGSFACLAMDSDIRDLLRPAAHLA